MKDIFSYFAGVSIIGFVFVILVEILYEPPLQEPYPNRPIIQWTSCFPSPSSIFLEYDTGKDNLRIIVSGDLDMAWLIYPNGTTRTFDFIETQRGWHWCERKDPLT